MADKLSLDDFFDMLGRYGADISHWPLSSKQMESVMAFVARSAAAREALAEMRQMEAGLRHDLPPAPVGLADRILAAAGVSGTIRPILAQCRTRRPILN